ncbi:MAG: hypothetical protein AAF226_06100 [Verrucomicrobiota bacterium]
MARRPRQDEERSMDSLMDAMTNVVGILLLILIVTSLGISSAVQKILDEREPVSEEQLAAMESSRAKTKDNLKELRSTYTKTTENMKSEEEKQQLAANLEKLEQDNAELADAAEQIAFYKAEIKKLEPTQTEKTERNTEAADQISELEALLANNPKEDDEGPREIVLPAPRDADPNAMVQYVAIKNNELFVIGDPYYHAIRVRDVLDQNFEKVAYTGKDLGWLTYNLNDSNPTYEKKEGQDKRVAVHKVIQKDLRLGKRDLERFGYMKGVKSVGNFKPDGTTVEKSIYDFTFGGANNNATESDKPFHLRKLKLDFAKVKAFIEATGKDAPFAYKVSQQNDKLRLAFAPNPGKGLSIEDAMKGGSAFAELCKEARAKRHVLYFMVASDSFDTYLQARAGATKLGINAGWNIWDEETLGNLQPQGILTYNNYPMKNINGEAYEKVAQAIGPALSKKHSDFVNGFSGSLAAVKPPEGVEDNEEFRTGLKAARQKFANDVGGQIRALYATGPFIKEFGSTQKVHIADDEHPPIVMHIRLFGKSTPPTVPPKKGGNNNNQNKKGPGGGIKLD